MDVSRVDAEPAVHIHLQPPTPASTTSTVADQQEVDTSAHAEDEEGVACPVLESAVGESGYLDQHA